MIENILRHARCGLVLLPLLGACGRSAQISSPAAGGGPAPQSVSVTDGESLIRAMHARYSGKWYRTMTFIQQTTQYNQAGSPTDQTWYEALSLPGKLRIDYGNPEAGNAVLFRSDSNYQFSGGRLTRTTSGFNELLVLGFDVYTQPPEVTSSVLRSLGFQMSKIRGASFDGRSVWVVGTTANLDSTSKQFWVDRERLVLVRTIEKRPDGRRVDVRFGDFVAAGNGWVAKQVFQLVDGQTRLHEVYTNIKADPAIDPAHFDPKQFGTVKHWSKP